MTSNQAPQIGIVLCNNAQPKYERRDLGGGAWISVRAITTPELDEISAEVDSICRDMRAGQGAVAFASKMIGHEIRADMLESDVFVAGLQERLTRFRVAVRCIGEFGNIFARDGENRIALDPKDEKHVAHFLLDPTFSHIVATLAYRGVHEILAEKKG